MIKWADFQPREILYKELFLYCRISFLKLKPTLLKVQPFPKKHTFFDGKRKKYDHFLYKVKWGNYIQKTFYIRSTNIAVFCAIQQRSFNPPFPSMLLKIINPFRNSRITANNDKVGGFSADGDPYKGNYVSNVVSIFLN